MGVIPAAGYATRLQPLACSKEVYRVRGRPVMDFILERMRLARCDELRVVTRPDKLDVIRHARRRGAVVVQARPASLAQSLLCGLRGLGPGDEVLIGFPDSIWEPIDGYRPVLELLRSGWKVALGLFEAEDMQRYEPVLVGPGGRVSAIEFKPANPSSNWLWGCAAASAGVLLGMRGYDEPGLFFDWLSRSGAVGAVRLSSSYLDMGTPEGLRAAVGA
ncbi:MAG: NTP transferase domain-containing protein [Solirubrobacterales bacterium]|nr:NTP transferase domain-containing protein [Solirubrobacterales bacterium]